MAWTLIQLLTVLLIFSSEKPARSYCQDLIKDLKASNPGGRVSLAFAAIVAVALGVVPVVVFVTFHPVDKYGSCYACKRER